MQIQLQDFKYRTQSNRGQQIQLQQRLTSHSTNDKEEKERFYQPMILFILVIIAQLITVHLALLLTLDIPKTIVFSIFIGMTVLRCILWFYNSYYLVKFSRKLRKAYFKLDNHFVMYLSTCVTYIVLNFSSSSQAITIVAQFMYPILFFVLVGNYRVMIYHCDWSLARVRIYKLTKAYSSIFFLGYGIFRLEGGATDEFLLYVFTTFGFYCELYFGMQSLNEKLGYE